MKKKSKASLEIVRKALLTTIVIFVTLFITWFQESAVETPKLPQGSTPILYTNHTGDDLRALFHAGIEEAQSSVLLVVYSLTDKEIINALNQKSRAGITVRVITDGTAVPFVDRQLHSDIDVTKRFGKGLMHLKLLVVDGKRVWIGSANMTKESLRMHGNLVMGLESEPLAAMITEKAHGIPEEGSSAKVNQRTFPLDEGQNLGLCFLPDNRDGTKRILNMISAAKKTIKVALFTWTRKDFAEAIANAADRGVKVEAVIDYTAGHGAGAQVVKFLKQRGISVRLSQSDGLLHHKMMIIDDQILVNGSANWTKAAFTQNDDCFIVLDQLNEAQKQEAARDVESDCQRIKARE